MFTSDTGTDEGVACIQAKAAADATAEAPTVSTISGVWVGLRQNNSRFIVDANAELHISSLVSNKRKNGGTGNGENNKLLKQGAGKLLLTNANTYTGGTSIEAGVLELQDNGTLGSGEVTIGSATESSSPALVFASHRAVKHGNLLL